MTRPWYENFKGHPTAWGRYGLTYDEWREQFPQEYEDERQRMRDIGENYQFIEDHQYYARVMVVERGEPAQEIE